jgi:hypothetical protein
MVHLQLDGRKLEIKRTHPQRNQFKLILTKSTVVVRRNPSFIEGLNLNVTPLPA